MGFWKIKISWVLVAHTCNPSYSGGRNQKFVRSYLEKNPSLKRAGGVGQGVSPEFKP
jgi:hypothetical protein